MSETTEEFNVRLKSVTLPLTLEETSIPLPPDVTTDVPDDPDPPDNPPIIEGVPSEQEQSLLH